MKKNLLMPGLKFICSKTSSFDVANPNYKTPSLASFHFHKLYTSKSEWFSKNRNSHHSENEIKNENPVVEVVSIEDLKREVDKLNKGEFEAIPTILESILKRMLSRKPEESGDKFLKTFSRWNQVYTHVDSDSNSDEYFRYPDTDSDSYSDVDSDSDSNSGIELDSYSYSDK